MDLGLNDESKCVREAIPFENTENRVSNLQLTVKDKDKIVKSNRKI